MKIVQLVLPSFNKDCAKNRDRGCFFWLNGLAMAKFGPYFISEYAGGAVSVMAEAPKQIFSTPLKVKNPTNTVKVTPNIFASNHFEDFPNTYF